MDLIELYDKELQRLHDEHRVQERLLCLDIAAEKRDAELKRIEKDILYIYGILEKLLKT